LHGTCLSEIDAVILAGGQGTRLRSLFPGSPKVLVPINKQPFLWHCIRQLKKFGARRIILSLGYKAEMVQEYVRAQTWDDLEIVTHVEDSPLGTGGAVRDVLPLIQSPTALVTNGDSVTRLDMCCFVEFHRAKQARVSMVLTYQPQVAQSGLVEADADGLVTSFQEKPVAALSGGYISAGLYLMEQEAIQEIEPGRMVSIEKDVFPRFCGRRFYAMKGEFPFIDIGTTESYRRACEFFREENP
jgi:NDP-sugar pyrophosphorylase family protein